jgi:MFS family permease
VDHRRGRVALGDGAFWLAVGVWVKDLTGSNARAALAMFCYLAPRMLSPLTSLVADRFRRRSVLLVTYPLLAAVVLAAVATVVAASAGWLASRRVFDGQLAAAAGTVDVRVPDAGAPGRAGAGRDAAADAADLEPV